MSPRAWPKPPKGFVLRADEAVAVYVAERYASVVGARGLDAWDEWVRALASGSTASGRGATAIVEGAAGRRWRLKAMRRGGWLARIWGDRYPSARRLVATLAASAEAQARGVPTADPVVLIVKAGYGGLVRGAIGFEELERSVDLARLVTGGAATREALVAAIEVVRSMHDRGVSHPDLNLGNVLVRTHPSGLPEVYIVDFDRATFTAGPLPFRLRQAGLRRLERSCAKLTGNPGPLGPGSEELWYNVYAGENAELADRLEGGRRLGRLSLAAHRIGWRRHEP